MRSEGFVTVVPVDRGGGGEVGRRVGGGEAGRRGGDGEVGRRRDRPAGKLGEWSSREQSPCTARQNSKGSRRDPSPYSVKTTLGGGGGEQRPGRTQRRGRREQPLKSCAACSS